MTLSDDNNIEYLTGSRQVDTLPIKPFDSLVCEFLEIFSKKLSLAKDIKNYPDLKTLSFWCRKGNIENIKKRYFSEDTRMGLGMIFHITPSNIPTVNLVVVAKLDSVSCNVLGLYIFSSIVKL